MAFNPDDWQLIKFGPNETVSSVGMPATICNVTAPNLTFALFLAKKVNPQQFYWINTMSKVPAGVSTVVSEGHFAKEFPQGYGGSSCDGTPWPPVDPLPGPVPSNYTLQAGKAIGGQDIKGYSAFGDCKAACDADPNCAGFTVMAGARAGNKGRWCGLKSSTTTMGANTNFDTFTKNPPAPPPVDCVLGDWSAWSSCGTDGTIKRTRTPTVQPANGGKACDSLVDTLPCPTPAITVPVVPVVTPVAKSGALPTWAYWAIGGGALFVLLIIMIMIARSSKKKRGGNGTERFGDVGYDYDWQSLR